MKTGAKFGLTSLALCLGALVLGGASASASAGARAPRQNPRQAIIVTEAAGLSSPVITHHEGTFNGKLVAYDALVEAIVVPDAAGKPSARLVGFSYMATKVADPVKRPVLFVFNGGPIAPSNILHMGAFGPKRVAIPDDLAAPPSQFRLVDNPYTVLDVADIVFFDPASTGYSRVLPGVDPKSYFSVTADAQQFAQFVIQWSRRHGRLASPKYVLGESYGTMRAAAAANQLQKLGMPLDGVVLLGQALNIIEFSQRPANVTSYVISLPTLAAIAWSHHKADLGGQSFDQFEAEVERFSRDEYLPALFLGSSLDSRAQARIAERLARYTGIPADWYLAHGLRISKERYRRELLKSQGLILGMTDGRLAGPAPAKGEAFDPAGVIPKAYDKAFEAYVHADLGVKDAGPYVTEDPVAGLGGWRWGPSTSPFGDWPYPDLLTEVFAANPEFRVMVGNGWEDTMTTVGAARLLVDQSGWPGDRTSLDFYQGGHMAYSIEDSLRRITNDVHAFITKGPRGG